MLPIDQEGCTTLVGQYRYVLDRYTWELPGGGGQYDRPAVESARQELSEETGYCADHWLQIVDACVSPGTSDDVSRAFAAWGLHGGTPHPEPDEQLAYWRVSFLEAVSMAISAEITHLASVAALLSLHTRLIRRDLPMI